MSGRRLTDTEALMWRLEGHPHLRAVFGNVTVLDRPPDLDRLRHRVAETVEVVPRLRRRVVDNPAPLVPPRWDDDADFDLDHHLRRVALPPPGTHRQLLDLAAALCGDSFDPARPLWQFVVVEGLDDGRAAMVQRLHHTVADGEGALRLSLELLDLEREAAQPASVALGTRHVPRTRSQRASAGPAALAGAAGTAAEAATRAAGVAIRALGGALGTVVHPTRVPRAAGSAVAATRTTLRQAGVVAPARSPVWTRRGLRRRLETLRVPLDDAHRAAHALGGTVNDLLVTAACTAAGDYHRAVGAPVDEMRMAMPVSTRSGGDPASNAFTLTRLLVPVGPADPPARFAEVRRRLAEVKGAGGHASLEGVAGLLAAVPTPALLAVAERQVRTVDFATSNVRGAPVPLYLAGAEVLANHPVGPTMGTAFNLTVLSYAGQLDMTCHVDLDAVEDPGLLLRCLGQAFDALLAAG